MHVPVSGLNFVGIKKFKKINFVMPDSYLRNKQNITWLFSQLHINFKGKGISGQKIVTILGEPRT